MTMTSWHTFCCPPTLSVTPPHHSPSSVALLILFVVIPHPLLPSYLLPPLLLPFYTSCCTSTPSVTYAFTLCCSLTPRLATQFTSCPSAPMLSCCTRHAMSMNSTFRPSRPPVALVHSCGPPIPLFPPIPLVPSQNFCGHTALALHPAFTPSTVHTSLSPLLYG
jgi:hypothetical protein